uniref:Uncharacterized protein n=1 Tax=viral metagenome TaxID=1070528 RepID=A0A6C0CVK5_9ZZZZ
MFGTDLQQAYDPGMNTEPQNMIHLNSASDMDREVEQKQAAMHHQHEEQHQPTTYDTNSFFRDNQMQNQLSQLQEELRLQKQKTYKTSNDVNIIDRFVSKKKDVIKLVLISLTIVLAFSLHYVIHDALKAYLMNSILTPSQELMTKLAYPVTILLVIWTIKVFNK